MCLPSGLGIPGTSFYKNVLSLGPPTSRLTISKISKFGKALEGDPSLGSEYYTTIPGLTEDMVALDHLL